MSIEAGVVIHQDGSPIHWHLPQGRTAGSLPDSRTLWDVIWDNRATLAGFAHSHPGYGIPGPSMTDLTTFSAIEIGIGRKLIWWIASEDRLIALRFSGPGKYDYKACVLDDIEPFWIQQLRVHSR